VPSAFKSTNIEALLRRRKSVDAEIAGLVNFRDRIDRRIVFLMNKPDYKRIIVAPVDGI